MFRRRLVIGLLWALTIFVLVISLSLALSSDAKLEEYVAQSIIQENVAEQNDPTSLTGSVIVRLSNVVVYEGPSIPLRAWQYVHDNLVAEDTEIYQIAAGSERSKWPPLTFEFDVRYYTPLVARIRLFTLYNQGILPTSRGGHADTWTLVNVLGNWLIVNKQSGEYWD
jgi:hypothetical protein